MLFFLVVVCVCVGGGLLLLQLHLKINAFHCSLISHQFLINREGQVVKRYGPTDDPSVSHNYTFPQYILVHSQEYNTF